MPKTVSVRITADENVSATTSKMSKNVRRSADEIKSAAGQAIGSVSALTAANNRLVKAQAAVETAAGAVSAAESRLVQVRSRARSTALQNTTAEEGLAKAQRELILSQRELATAQAKAGRSKFLSSITDAEPHLNAISGALLRVGAVSAIGLGASVKAAVDFESAFTGVTKTVDGTAEQYGVLSGQLRGLAKTLPESAVAIAQVAENAGQLGIKRDSIAEFTKVMVELGDTTNLSADQAATSLAQFGNIMGTLNGSATEVNDRISRLGATIVGLGNDGASTEANIVDMGLRIAGAGKQIGLSSPDVLGFASAISSTGIEAEAGGTAISQSFIKIDQAVRKGGNGLQTLARVSGETTSQFASDFRTKPAQAINSFVEGLGKIQASGGDVTAVLKDIGVTGVREGDVLRRLASASKEAGNQVGLLGHNLDNASVQYQRNSALVDEAAKRYSTTESQAKIALNQVQDSAISVGQAILPAVAQVATVIGTIATAFGELPSPARNAAVAIAATVAVMSLAGGGAIRAVTGLVNLGNAFKAAGVASETAGRAFKIAGLSIPVVGIALFAITTAIQHFAGQATSAQESASSFAAAMETVAGSVTRATAAMNDNVRAAAIEALQQKGAFDQAKALGLSLSDVTDASLGNADAIGRVNAVLKTNLAFGPQSSAADNARRNAATGLAEALGGVANDSTNATKAEQDRRAAMEGGVGATKTAAKSAQELAAAQQEVAAAIQQTVAAATAAASEYVSMTNAQIAAVQALDAIAKASQKQRNAGLSKNSAAGQANNALLNNVITSQSALFSKSVESQDPSKIAAGYAKATAAVAKSAEAFGKGKRQAEEFAASLFKIPPSIKTQIVVAGAKVSQAEAAGLNKALKSIPPESRAKIVTIAETKGAAAARAAIESVKDKTVIARTKGEIRGAQNVAAAMRALKDRLVKATARGDKKGADTVRTAIASLKSRTVGVNVKADTSGAAAAQGAINAVQGKTVNVTVVKRTVSAANAAGANADGGVVWLAGGGHVIRGRGGPRQDNIVGIDGQTGLQTSRVSVGEMVTNAASTAANLTGLKMINEGKGRRFQVTPLASGGLVGYANGGAVNGRVATTDVQVLIRALQNPIKDILYAAKVVSISQASVASALAASRVEQAKIAQPTARLKQATRTYQSRVDDRQSLRERAARLKRAADATKGSTKADKEYRKVQADLRDANVRVTRSSIDKRKAQQAYDKVSGPAKAATDRLAAAQQALKSTQDDLVASQKALADSARGVSDQFSAQYRSSSTDAQDWIDLMTSGAQDLKTFNQQIIKLRKVGLSDTLVQQVLNLGAVQGGEIANQILAGGKGVASALNSANSQLQSAADSLGYTSVAAPKRYAVGGYLRGPGSGTSDSLNIRASAGEYVVNAAATAANRSVLDAINYGRAQVAPQRFTSGYAAGGFVQRPGLSPADLQAALANANFYVQSPIDGRYFKAFVRSEASGVVGEAAVSAGLSF